MSGLAVIFQRSGAPVERETLTRMTDIIAHRGPDGIGHWIEGPVGLGHCALHTLPEDVGQTQPIASTDGQLHLTFDGRIDNREDLIPQLGLETTVSDARVVLAAYEKWGEFCPERLLGDFAFALWDGREQQLFCARDILGVKPFLYYRDNQLFLAATERRQLFTHPRPTKKANERVVAGLMMLRVVSPDETLHEDVQRLAAAHCLTVSMHDVRLRRYWHPQEVAPLNLRSDDEYAEKFWNLLCEATRCRLRHVGGVGLLLSGGLDSTIVAASAMEVKKGRPSLGGGVLPAYSLNCKEWIEADEAEYQKSAADYYGLNWRSFPPWIRPAGACEQDVGVYRDLPDYYNDSFLSHIRSEFRDGGQRVVLSGNGGDEWFAGSPLVAADQLRRGEFVKAWRSASAVTGQSPLGSYWRHAVRPNLPAWAALGIRAIRNATRHGPDWLEPQFARRIGALDLKMPLQASTRRIKVNHVILTHYEQGVFTHMFEHHERLNARYGLEHRHPLSDRRLIEFSSAIPGDQCWRNGTRKHVLRLAGRNRMPPAIVERSTKANFTRQMIEELGIQAGPGFFAKSLLAEHGWVHPKRLDEFFRRVLASAPQSGYRGHLNVWQLFGLELMARSGCLTR
jgi:asparagine synthase (glutamine-hydrolysing)